VHNIISTRSSAALAAFAFLGIASCESTEDFDCASKPSVCAYADLVARDIDSRAGMELSDQITLRGASADGPTVNVAYDLIYTRAQLGGNNIQTLRSIAYESLAYGFCRPESRQFLVDGGRLRLTIYSLDGKSVASSYLDECPQGEFETGRIRE
jgi:hypothetical protein